MKTTVKTIECDNRMEVIKFFGFYVKENAIQEKNFLDMCKDESGAFELFIDGESVATFNWFDHFWNESTVSENDIWAWMLAKCREYTRAPKIYVEKSYVDQIYSPLANLLYPKSNEEIQEELDSYK